MGRWWWRPSRARVLQRAREWLEEQAGHLWLGAEGRPQGFRAELYPGLGYVDVWSLGRGDLRLQAETSRVGPGFHVWLAKLCRAMSIDLPLKWVEPLDRPAGVFGDVEDESRVEAAMLEHAQVELAGVLDEAGGEYSSPLGPRGAEELRRWQTDAAALRDFFPWWQRGNDALYYLRRALVLMWLELRWRAPESEAELQRMQHAHEMLLMARSRDPQLELPWHGWLELLHLLDVQGSIKVEVEREAAARPDPGPMGYRRHGHA
jgi:hypothetical protein